MKDVARPTKSDRGLPPAMSPRIPSAYDEPSLITNGGFSQTYSTIPNSTAVQINVSGAASNSLGITSLVLGILSLFTCWIPIIGLLIGGVSLALGIAAIVVAMKRNGSGVGYGIGGVTLGGITVLGSIAFISALVMSPELNRSSFDRFVDNSEQSPTAGFAKYRSRKWNSLTYQTTFTYVRDNVWAERYYDGRLVRQLDEVSSNDGFLELREQDRGLVVRVYPDRQEFMDQGQWKWVATGQWENL